MADLGDLSVLSLLPDPIVVVAADGTVAHCTPLAGRLVGGAPDDLVGRPAGDVFPLIDDTGADWWKCAHALDADPRLLPRTSLRDLTLRTLDGGSRPVSVTASRIAGPDDRLSHVIVVLRRAEARQRLDAARSDLVSTVSHEIRSPLTSVKGFTKTLLAKWDRFTDDQKRQMLATVNEDADRVTRLLGELLDVSRIDAGRLQLRRQMVDVAGVVARVVDRVEAKQGDHRINNRVGELPRLYADPDKVEQIFTNLVENALKYGEGEIELTADVSETVVTFTVADQGAGIAPEYLTQIFTKFFRRAGERRTGTGLGLYITKGIVEAHGGRIWAVDTHADGQTGARLRFTLPQGGLELAGIDVARRS